MKLKESIILSSTFNIVFLSHAISSLIVHWKKFNYITHDLTCPPSKILFSETNVRDAFECSKLCTMQHTCLTSNFRTDDHFCTGCEDHRVSRLEGTPDVIHHSIKQNFDYDRDCVEILQKNKMATSGVYLIRPLYGTRSIDVLCDMSTDGGGWIVFQKRFNGSVDFDRNLTEYENGFGNLDGEFWLGLDIIRQLTKTTSDLMYEVTSVTGTSAYEKYAQFEVIGPTSALILGNSVHETDLDSTLSSYDSAIFSIFDQGKFENCSGIHGGGWWYKNNMCGNINLNGKYGPGGGFYHKGLLGNETLKSSRMMTRIYTGT